MTGREYYIKLAGQGLRMPVGTDLILNEESADPEQARNDGAALGRVIEKSARRWKTPLAVPLMDLRLEKIDLLARIGIGEKEAETFHFDAPLDDAKMAVLCGADAGSRCPGSVARDEALKYIGTLPDLVPVGMAIGPFSLVTRLMGDPITAAAQAGRGISEEDSDDVRLLFQCLKMAEFAVDRALRSQIAHGAKAIMVCEPAANTAYLSPRQIRSGSDVFERIVMQPNLRMLEIFKSTGC
ncbi:MAG: hypothetical protein FWD64_04650, partial [Acidobacteriaceae bacterium]|nr:hypothetical protein [Acidobacteriaceae bacterium]